MKKLILILCAFTLVLGFAGLASADPADLDEFSFDGCSSIAPEGYPWGGDPYQWCDCCLAHDKKYWQGGTYQDRLNADDDFFYCMLSKTNYTVATLFYLGVRAGGSPFFYTPYRWGYGWPYGRFYQALNMEEQAMADMLLNDYEEANWDKTCAEQIE